MSAGIDRPGRPAPYRPNLLHAVLLARALQTPAPTHPPRRRIPRHRSDLKGTTLMATWPAPFRHLILIVVSGLLAWAGTDLIPWVKDQAGYGILAASLLTALLAYFTPLIQSYGFGAGKAGVNR